MGWNKKYTWEFDLWGCILGLPAFEMDQRKGPAAALTCIMTVLL